MKNYSKIFLLGLTIILSGVFITPTFSASSNDPLNLLGNNSENNEEKVPNVRDMSSRWWTQYADIKESKKFQSQFEKFVNTLESAAKNVEGEQRENLLERIAIIRNLAQEYKKLYYDKVESQSIPHELILKDTYTVGELLEANQLKRQVNFLLDQTEDEITRVSQSIQQTNDTIDVIKVSYLNSEEGSEEQLAVVLNWVNSQLSKVIEGELLHNLKKREETLKAEQQNILSVLDSAKERLTFTAFPEKEREKLQNAKSDLEEDIKQLNLKLSRDISETSIGFTSYEILKLDLSLALLSHKEILMTLQRAGQQDKLFNISKLESKSLADLGELRELISSSENLIESTEEEISKAESLAQDTLLSSDINLRRQDAEKPEDLQELSEERRKKAQSLLKVMSNVRANISDNELILSLLKDIEDIHQSGLNKTWDSVKEFTQDTWEATVKLVNRPLFSINERPITILPLIQLCFIILMGYLVSKLVSFLVHRFEKKHKIRDNSSVYLLHRLIHYLIIFIAAVAGFSALGLNLSNLTLIAGALSVGIGFGLQNLVSNFVSGLTIMFEKTLKVGDYIELEDGTTGQVKEIKTRSTRINTNDNIDVIIPNSYMVTNIVTNWTLKESTRRVRIPFGVAYGTDKDIVKKAAIEAASNVQYTLKNLPGKEPDVWLTEFGDNSVNYLLLVWVAHYGVRRPTRMQSMYMWELDTALKKYGIEIPFPQRDVHLNIVNDEDKHSLPLQSVTGESLPIKGESKSKKEDKK